MSSSNDFSSHDMVRFKDNSHITTPDKIKVDGVSIAISSHADQQIKAVSGNLLAVYPKGTYVDCEGEIIYLGQSIATCADFELYKEAVENMLNELQIVIDHLIEVHKNNIKIIKLNKQNKYWKNHGKPERINNNYPTQPDSVGSNAKVCSKFRIVDNSNEDVSDPEISEFDYYVPVTTYKYEVCKGNIDYLDPSFAVYPIRNRSF